jgi:hypothetical protein
MQIVVSKKPEIYIPNRELIIHYPTHKTSLADIVSKTEEFKPVMMKILSALFEKLTELSVSFQLVDLKIEQDAGIEGWRYILARIKIDVSEEIFNEACNFFLTYAYSMINPKDAIKVLLEFERV